MPVKSRLSFRELLSAAFLLTGFILLLCLVYSCHAGKSGFHAFVQDLYEREMTSNTLSLHYGLANPEAFGIEEYDVTLPTYVPGSAPLRADSLSETLGKLTALDRSRLTDQEAYACECLERELLLARATADYPYYSDPLSPSFGIQGQLPILLAEYAFRSRRDVDEYLELLGQTWELYDSMLIYEKERAAYGLPLFLSSLKKTEEQCDTIVTSESLQSGEHFLQSSFRERLNALSASIGLTKEEQLQYESQNDAMLEKVFLPACRHLKEGLRDLESLATPDVYGLAHLPSGKEYYACLLAEETGSGKSPEEARALLLQMLSSETQALSNISKASPESLRALKAGSHEGLGFTDASVIIEDLKLRMDGDYPTLEALAFPGSQAATVPALPSAVVKTVMPGMQDFLAPAFYLTTPMDDVSQNVIYVNPKSTPNGLELYTTLAHEGYPGHLYQNACTAARLMSMESDDARKIRHLIGCSGYVEGWALYVEQRAYDQAASILAGRGRKTDSACILLEKHQRSFMLCLYSLLDVMIHYDGASKEDAARFLSTFGIRDEEGVSAIYDYICLAPGNYLKYYLGYLEILELREQAKKLWKSEDSDLRFHQFLLSEGPADFVTLKGRLR